MAQTLPHQTLDVPRANTITKKHQQPPASSGKTQSSLGVVSQRALHPEYTDYVKRLNSFINWPTNKTQKPEPMAEAGFYYAGVKDCVKCYFCNGGLWNWYPGDEPMTEHKRWFPKCGFLQLLKTVKMDRQKSLPHMSLMSNTSTDSDREKEKKKSKHENSLETYMKSPTVQAVLNMKMFDQKQILYLVQRKIESGSEFVDAASLMEELYAMEDEENSGAAGVSNHNASSTASNASTESSSDGVNDEEDEEEEDEDDSDDDSSSLTKDLDRLSNSSKPQEPSSRTRVTNLSGATVQQAPSTLATASETYPSNIAVKKKKKNKKKKKKQKSPDPIPEEDIKKQLEELQEESNKLEEERKKLLDARTCKVCMDKAITTVFLPCGHLTTCEGCAELLKNCPLCRTRVNGTVKAYVC